MPEREAGFEGSGRERDLKQKEKRMTNRMDRAAERLILAVFITLASAAVAFAQNSTLRGQVVDERGDAIPNAAVILIAKDGKERKTKSGATGDFTIQNVPAGNYTLTASYQGFQTQTVTELKTPYSGVLSVKLAIAAVEVITDVSANNTAVSTEPDQNMNAITLSEQEIANLVFGSNIYSAEYSNPGFGRVEIITKPGYGDWRDSGSFGYRNAALDARNAFALAKPDLQQQRYDFFMGGPLLKKRLSTSFFANRSDLDGSGATIARILDANLAEVE